MFGLPDQVLTLILEYFQKKKEISKVMIYGSRAIGREKLGSDIDLAIITTSDRDISAQVKADLEDLSTPYMFDVVDYRRITHNPLKAHIDRVAKTILDKK